MKTVKHIFAFLIISCAIIACSDDDSGSSSKEETGTRRTVVMYVSAENSLGYQKFNSSDSAEIMAGSQFLNARDQMIMYVDDAKNPRIYRIYKGCIQPQKVVQFEENLCSSDPKVLRDILAWVKTEYPSESYGLILWSHADGWLPSWNRDYVSTKSFGIDVGTGGNMRSDIDKNKNYGAAMDIDSLAWAVAESGMYPQYIFFDACLMQCIETDYALRNVTDYVVACPISTPAIGANYTTLMRNALFTDDPSKIANEYFSYITTLPSTNAYNDFGLVISCVKTSELENLAAVTRTYISNLNAYTTDEDGNTTQTTLDMTDVTQYAVYGRSYFYRPHFYDMNEAMKTLLAESDYNTWKQQLDKCIAYKNATEKFYIDSNGWFDIYGDVNLDTYCAISAFIPQKVYTQNANSCIYGDLNEIFRNTEWYEDAGWKDAGW